ncbi:tumor necrosis factor receptor superfamily member 16 [Clarias gariepinus]|uniref:tumor necrosis factor receptor superfamily member 16 n=1 Tax=Clarias gariepinus TaxID=13013 RepID=UPI00234D0586|nr:tumor necrosis factor receptor superfamily member 16 [Clarias gariepinus]
MDTRTWMVFCAAVAVVCGSTIELPSEEICDSGTYTNSGECCMECPPGEGVIKPCGETQTECSQCLDSETYSDQYSHTDICHPCTECTGLMRMETPCTDSNDAVCVCDYGYYMNDLTGSCEPCTVCPRGQGVYTRCEPNHDTKCEPCEDDTYSDQESTLDPCMPCTICNDGSEELETLRECSPTADALCYDPLAPTISFSSPPPDLFTDGVGSPGPDEESTTTKPSSPRFIGSGINENLIPIYCSTLAAVLIGLLAYIVFKRWNSCKQNKQAANNRAATANQTSPSPEGEKLHSDSGISVDSQSLQEQQQLQTQAEAHTQTQTQLHVPEQIVVRVDGGAQSDSPPSQA